MSHANPAAFGLPADLSTENPYEDIELESQCSQQSLPSSPGADSSKVAAEHTGSPRLLPRHHFTPE